MNQKGKTALFYAREPKCMYLLLSFGACPTLGRSTEGDNTLLEEYIRKNPTNARGVNFWVDDLCKCRSHF